MFPRLLAILTAFRQINYEKLYEKLVIAQHSLIGFPHTIESDIDWITKFNGSQSEMKYYYLFNRSKRVKFFFPIIGLLIALKSLYYLWYLLSSVETIEKGLDQVSHNITRKRNHSELLLQIDCLRTNCIRKDLLLKLPVFSLCKPDLRPLYNPQVELHTFGAIMNSCYAMLLITLGVLVALYLYFLPMGHESVMFKLAPNVGRDSMRAHIKGFMGKLYLSMVVYSARHIKEKPEPLLEEPSLRFVGMRKRISSSRLELRACRENLAQIHFDNMRQRVYELERDYNCLSGELKLVIDDALTVFRTKDSCRRISMKQYVLLFLMLTGLMCFNGVILLRLASGESKRRMIYLQHLQEQYQINKCSIWYADKPDYAINLSEVPSFRFNLLNIIELMCGLVTIMFIPATLMGAFLTIIREIHNMMHEQIYKINMVIEMSYIIHSLSEYRAHSKVSNLVHLGVTKDHWNNDNNDNQDDYFDDDNSTINEYTFEKLTNLIAMDLCSVFGTAKMLNMSSRPQKDIVSREMAINLLVEQGANMNSFSVLLAKIYCGNMLLMHCIKNSTKNLSAMLVFSILLNFTVIVVIQYMTSKLGEYSSVQLTMALGGVVICASVIIYPSMCQATSKRIVYLMWRLLAATVNFEDVRVKQIRSLYLKQLEALCREGGMTLRAFGTPVTYDGLIRVILSTSTLFVLTLSRENKGL